MKTIDDSVHVESAEMSERVRLFDWSKTPLGPIESWSPALRMMIRFLLANRFPLLLWWGPQYISLYNDAYRPVLGTKHPWALGRPVSQCWKEIWHILKPLIDTPFHGGPATWNEDISLEINRYGFVEETHFTIAYSPVPDDTASNGIGGVLATVHEITETVIGERRVRALRDLGARVGEAKTAEEACAIAAETLTRHQKDVPFSLLYLIDAERKRATLAGYSGVEAGQDISSLTVELSQAKDSGWPLAAAMRHKTMEVVQNIAARFAAIPKGPWPDPPNTAVVVPILSNKAHEPAGLLVAGISAALRWDESYRGFFELLGTQITTAVANAHAYEHEKRRAEELAELDRAKTAFFSNVSHEFRTPLTLILGPLEDALAETKDPCRREWLGLLHRNALRAQKLVNKLLEFSRIEAGRIRASFEPIDLSLFTSELASVFRSAIEKEGMRLLVQCPPLSDAVYVDRDMYEKIVLNLLSNAFKFTLEGEIEVCLRDAGPAVELSVRDTGAGIAKDQLPHIFERFHRVEGVPARTHEGTGIGLALVQELAKLHGGSVRVRSELGQGSTFTLTLPKGTSHLPGDRIGAPSALPLTPMAADDYLGEALSWVDHETDQLPIFDPKLQGNSLGTLPVDIVRPRIVWADDNADMRNYVVRLLTRSYSVEACSDGETALAAVRREFPDLVLADVMMPRLDGFGLVRELRAIEQTREIPVILLSARAGEEARVEGLRAGADDYLVKPFSGGELLGRVEAHLKLARVRRDSATALRHRAEQFETLFNVAPLGVYVVDADFRIAQVNPIARPFFGDLPGGVLGRDFDQIIHMVWDQDYADELVQIFRQTLASGDSCVAPERAEFRIDRNAIEYYEWRVDRITLPDGKFGVVCYFRDISEQIRVRMLIEQSRDALREADRRKDEFLATLAHELRNPLAPIRNSIFILRSITSERAESLLEMMERQVSQMVRLVDDLMEVSRITTGKIKLLKERMELKGIVQSAIETSTPVIDAARHRLSVSLPIEELMLEGDPVRLAQVLSNLLNNAAKYTEEGGQIWLAAQREGSNVVISVRDNGIGIPGEMIPKIFDLFAQVDRSHSRDQGGLGIGLTLARSLIEMHGGTIQARSDGPDQGSEFVLRLPLVTEPSGTIPHRAWDESLGPVRPRCMLVVDDNRDSADTLAMLLKFQGAEAYTANDGPTALEALHKYRPSIVLLDIGLPGMDGFEVAQRIRELKEYRDTILVALTGWGQEEDREKSKAAGIDYHLVKPDDLRTLQDLMASMPEEQPRAVTTSL